MGMKLMALECIGEFVELTNSTVGTGKIMFIFENIINKSLSKYAFQTEVMN